MNDHSCMRVSGFTFTLALLALPGVSHQASSFEPLRKWVEAVESHVPGTVGSETVDMVCWPEAQLQLIVEDISDLARFLVQAHARLRRSGELSRFSDGRRSLSLADAERLLGVTQEEAERGDVSRILIRGAAVHTDVAKLGNASCETPSRASGSRPALFGLDGRQQGLGNRGPHWEFARALLDASSYSGSALDRKRQWYLAAAAYMHSRTWFADLVPHLTHAERLFPTDAGILFQIGWMHEAMASPAVQRVLEQLAPPPGMRFELTSAATHRRHARTYFHRALSSAPDHVEARLRLGRVLAELGSTEEAERELRQALAAATTPMISYYAELFLGDVQAAQGRHEAARESFERAAALYPTAQSPRMALSRLARAIGNHAAAEAALEQWFMLPGGAGDAREDPWWTYYEVRKAEADLLLDEWHRSILTRGGDD